MYFVTIRLCASVCDLSKILQNVNSKGLATFVSLHKVYYKGEYGFRKNILPLLFWCKC